MQFLFLKLRKDRKLEEAVLYKSKLQKKKKWRSTSYYLINLEKLELLYKFPAGVKSVSYNELVKMICRTLNPQILEIDLNIVKHKFKKKKMQ